MEANAVDHWRGQVDMMNTSKVTRHSESRQSPIHCDHTETHNRIVPTLSISHTIQNNRIAATERSVNQS